VRKLVVSVTVACIATGLGAAPSAAGSGDVRRFCRAHLALETSSEEDSGRQLAQMQRSAPPAIADAVNAAADLLEQAGDLAFTNSTFRSALADIDSFVLDRCGYEQIDVVMEDHAFNGVPDEIERGTVAFNLSNEGLEVHEFAVGRLKRGASLDDILAQGPDFPEEALEPLVQQTPGYGLALPGESDAAVFKLGRPGRYVALCFIPVGATDELSAEDARIAGAPAHAGEGMAIEFEVVE
jgi:hypothetical protein